MEECEKSFLRDVIASGFESLWCSLPQNVRDKVYLAEKKYGRTVADSVAVRELSGCAGTEELIEYLSNLHRE